ncbi:hypothetical protein QBC44DRAFT_384508 [Cladorrhinum sp. PSN332]|nr:hypothetical protein QBC44DRAFT_384508 [Cladorrhinum sp. PSN332]
MSSDCLGSSATWRQPLGRSHQPGTPPAMVSFRQHILKHRAKRRQEHSQQHSRPRYERDIAADDPNDSDDGPRSCGDLSQSSSRSQSPSVSIIFSTASDPDSDVGMPDLVDNIDLSQSRSHGARHGRPGNSHSHSSEKEHGGGMSPRWANHLQSDDEEGNRGANDDSSSDHSDSDQDNAESEPGDSADAMYNDNDIDEVMTRIAGIVLDFCGGRVGNTETLKAIIKIVELAVAEFINDVLNDIAWALTGGADAGKGFSGLGAGSSASQTASHHSNLGAPGGSQNSNSPGSNGGFGGNESPGPGQHNQTGGRVSQKGAHAFIYFSLLKRHVRDTHQQPASAFPFPCERCNKGFSTKDELKQHIRQPEPCNVMDSEPAGERNPEDGISPEADERLRDRGARGITTWQGLWNILFPDDVPASIPPSAFIPPEELDGVGHRFTETRSILHQRIQTLLRNYLSDNNLASQLSQQTVGLVDDYIQSFLIPEEPAGPAHSPKRISRASRKGSLKQIASQTGPRKVAAIASASAGHPARPPDQSRISPRTAAAAPSLLAEPQPAQGMQDWEMLSSHYAATDHAQWASNNTNNHTLIRSEQQRIETSSIDPRMLLQGIGEGCHQPAPGYGSMGSGSMFIPLPVPTQCCSVCGYPHPIGSLCTFTA